MAATLRGSVGFSPSAKLATRTELAPSFTVDAEDSLVSFWRLKIVSTFLANLTCISLVSVFLASTPHSNKLTDKGMLQFDSSSF